MAPVIAAIVLFIVAALLWHQATYSGIATKEHFRNLPPIRPYAPATVCNGAAPVPTAGRRYGAEGECDDKWFVPGDLAKAPQTGATQPVANSVNRPVGAPGPGTAPPNALASRKDLDELDVQISTWLASADQAENTNPGALTADQRQERIMLQGRLANIRDQIVTGMITDSYKVVAAETKQLRDENGGWQQKSPNMDAVYAFGKGLTADAFLTKGQYTEFRGLFNASLNELKGHIQPTPIQRVRVQQLEIMSGDLATAEKQYAGLPPIKVAAASLYLRQMLKPDQPLPTLFAMEPPPSALPSMVASPADVLRDLRNLQWQLTITYNPAQQALTQAINGMIVRLQQNPSPADVETARAQVAALQAQQGPNAAPSNPAMMSPGAPVFRMTGRPQPLQYDPANLQKRATVLCSQVHEAFPHDASALGCPAHPPANDYEAETTINTVCDRLRFSVPSVDPAQFNCPRRAV
jgi:hypothetical protein